MKETISALVVIGLILGAIVFAADIYGRYVCSNYELLTGKETKWVSFDVCYVKAAEGWQRYDEYKFRSVASEGLKSK